MPLRTPGQPERFAERYRERLGQEMADQGETDRSLAEKVTSDGYPLSFSAIYKTRTGSRRPAMDECYAVAHVLGYDSLDTFLEGPAWVRISRAAHGVGQALVRGSWQTRDDVMAALVSLDRAMADEDAVAALEQGHPGWRTEYAEGMTHDLGWALGELTVLWRFTVERLTEILSGEIDGVGLDQAIQELQRTHPTRISYGVRKDD